MPRPAHGDAEAKLDMLGLDALCDEIVEGKTITNICRELVITKGSLIRWLSLEPEREKRLREARVLAAESFVEMADDELANASDPFELAKAKERGYHWRWKASKIDPRNFGDKTEITGPGGGPLQTQSKLDVTGLSIEQLRALASIPVQPV